MQIAGSICKVCRSNIVFSDEGTGCARCGTAVHRACASGPKCDICGEPYQYEARSATDPMADALLPRALRPASTAVAVCFILAVMALLLVLVMFYLGMLA